jgi:hypothetical protein
VQWKNSLASWWTRSASTAPAEKVVAFLKEHATDVPRWLQSDAAKEWLGKAKGLGGLFGKE